MHGMARDFFTFAENNFGKCLLIFSSINIIVLINILLCVCPYVDIFVNITYRSEKIGGVGQIVVTSIDSRIVRTEQKLAFLRYLQWCS
jgi:hypothetical protein